MTRAGALFQCNPAGTRLDCGYVGIDQTQCELKGDCCWSPAAAGSSEPWCFHKGTSAVRAHIPPQCFKLLPASFESPPFDEASVMRMSRHFLANFDVQGTGAVIASPGAVPALPRDLTGGYAFHWMRDGALSVKALMETSYVTGINRSMIRRVVKRYVGWVQRVTAGSSEPKWNTSSGSPYAFDWCRPQTDGPPLRALTLLAAMSRFPDIDTWALARADLDWVVKHHANASCDLWEEGMDEANLLWNRVAMRAALLRGAEVAAARGDVSACAAYQQAARDKVRDPWADHLTSQGVFSECPAIGQSYACAWHGKQLDGAVILALVHADSATTAASDFASAAVARTVGALNAAFCSAYPVNRLGLPGILYGRWLTDRYGLPCHTCAAVHKDVRRGNPWVLVTAALANLLFRAARSAATRVPSAESVSAWRATFGANFGKTAAGLPADFVAAGDSVLRRLRMSVAPTDDDHLYEQLRQDDGAQFNAKDLTWSYAEVLSAIEQRRAARKVLARSTFVRVRG